MKSESAPAICEVSEEQRETQPPKKKSHLHCNRHTPIPIYGKMIQEDAYIHNWLEDSVLLLALATSIDDAATDSERPSWTMTIHLGA